MDTHPDNPTDLHEAVDRKLDEFYGPDTRIDITFPVPGGTWSRPHWTPGGAELADRIDAEATARGLGMADNYALTGAAGRVDQHGEATVLVTPLRPILDAIRAGQRDTGEFTDIARQWVEDAHDAEPLLWPLDDDTIRRVGAVWEPLGPRLAAEKRG